MPAIAAASGWSSHHPEHNTYRSPVAGPEEPRRLTIGELVKAAGLDRPLTAPGLAEALAGAARVEPSAVLPYKGLLASGIDIGALGATYPKSSIGEALSAMWRAQLTDARAQRQLAVSRQMSDAIAQIKLAGIAGLAGLETGVGTKGLLGPVNESVARLMKGMTSDLVASLRPVALLAAKGLTEAMRYNTERERAAQEALYEMGWWMPHSATMDLVGYVWRLALDGDATGVRQTMNEASHSREFVRQVKTGWMRHPVFAERRRFILDGLADHQRGRYRVSIPTLLPHLEGIAMAAFASGRKDAKMKVIIREAAPTYDQVMGDAIVSAVTTLWDSEGFDGPPGGRALNRHRILHGRSTGYGSEANSSRLLYTFDLLASLVERAERKNAGKG